MRRLLLTVVTLMATMALSASPAWWKSDEAGFPIERLSGIPVKPAADFWWLEIDNSQGDVTRRLFRGSEERQRMLVSASSIEGHRLERTWQGKVLVDEIEYGNDGEMLSETAFSKDKADQILWSEAYFYDSKRLAKVIRSDAQGHEAGIRSYRYDPEGRLLSVELGGYYGNADVGSIGHASLPQAFWQDAPDGMMRIDLFDHRGNVTSVRFINGDQIHAIQHFVYDKVGRLLSDKLDNFDEGTKILSTYGVDGKLAATTTSKKGSTIESREYQWDKAGNVVVETRTFPLPTIRIDRIWDENGKLTREERRENGEIVLVTSYEPDSVRLEETWAGNQLVVRTRFENGIKIKEEFYKNGKIVRTRDYK